jgi:hypothetical protein
MSESTAIHGPLGEWLEDRIPKLAGTAHRRFPTVPVQDFEQEIWLRAYKRKLQLAKHLREGKEAFIWRELNAAATRLGKEDDRYRRACKAAAAGYKVIDEQFYSAGVLAQVLPALIEAEWDVATAVANASHQTDAAGVHISSDDPAAQGNYMVILMDVCAAFGRLTRGERRFLEVYYGAGDEDTEQGRWDRQGLASSMGLTYEAFRKRAHRALRKLQGELGGEDPWRKRDREAA